MKNAEMANPNHDDLMDLDDPGNWDDDNAEPCPTTKLPTAAVMVTFSGEDFVRLAEQAEQAGVAVVAFVRDAALDKLALERVR